MSVCLLDVPVPISAREEREGWRKTPSVSFYVSTYIFVPSCILKYISGGVGVNPSSIPNVNMFEKISCYNRLTCVYQE